MSNDNKPEEKQLKLNLFNGELADSAFISDSKVASEMPLDIVEELFNEASYWQVQTQSKTKEFEKRVKELSEKFNYKYNQIMSILKFYSFIAKQRVIQDLTQEQITEIFIN